MKKLIIFSAIILMHYGSFGQCAHPDNVYSFTYSGKRYEIIKENKNWQEAGNCASARGGYLLEINTIAEQGIVNLELDRAGINTSNTRAPDGGNASYVWTGGNDRLEEGKWIWANSGLHFWTGGVSGNSMSGAFVHWGSINSREPDNYIDQQHALGLAITNWPNGLKGEWNDINENNALYYVVEYANTLGIEDKEEERKISVSPNPTKGLIRLQAEGSQFVITKALVYDFTGKLVCTVQNDKGVNELNLANLPSGHYVVSLISDQGIQVIKRVTLL